MRRHPVLLGAIALLAVVAAVVVAGAFSVPSNAITVDGRSMSRATLNGDLATIQADPAFACYLDASVGVRSGATAALPPLGGPGGNGTYDTAFVDFWLSQQVNNLLIEQLASRQHLGIDGTALAAGRADLLASINGTLAEAALATGQSAVCAPSAEAIVGTLPAGLVGELVRAQAAGDTVLADAAGYGLSTGELARYFSGHQEQFRTLCVSVIQAPSLAAAQLAQAAVAVGQPFATVAKGVSTDPTSAANGGALGCFAASQGAYTTVAHDVAGLAVGQPSQPIPNNASYLILEVTSTQPAAFEAVTQAVRRTVLGAGSTRASSELSALTRQAHVAVDPRYGRWAGTAGVGIHAPRVPASADILRPPP